jgi:uncharacterized protein (TIGR02246 family)
MKALTLGRAMRGAWVVALVAAGPIHAQSVEDEVRSAYEAWDQAFNSADAEAVAAAYADDALFLPATHDVISGPEGVQTFFSALFDMGVSGHKLDLIEARDEGDAVVAAANWSATGKDADGADQPWGGIATTVFERQESGDLILVLHTFN